MQTFKMVVFDMAGTTVNEDNVVYKTLQHSINAHGIAVELKEVLEYGAGKEKLKAIQDIAVLHGHKDPAFAQAVYNDFKPALKTAYKDLKVSAFYGVEDVLEILRAHNVQIVLNTGYDKKTAQGLIKKLGWSISKEFDLLVTADDVENSRPAPDMIFFAMQQLNITNAAQVVKIGDSAVDIEEGKNAGCGLSIGITTGAQTRDQLAAAKPDHILDHIAQLTGILFKR